MITPHYADLVRMLRTGGYREATDIIQSGDMLVQGDIITLWPAAAVQPIRLHYFGDDLERWDVRLADGSWQQQTAELPEIVPNALETEHGKIYPGEYVVHPFHGVGIFQSIITQDSVDGAAVTYIALEYAGNDRLLVPHDRQAELMPYIGSRQPRLTRLYSKAWQNTKERVQRDLIRVARGLLKIYAARQLHPRQPYALDTDIVDRLADNAGFDLTDDQARAVKEITHDLTVGGQPMDRLLCGDVGFGKTEVALRAAALVVASGKQVAFIAPTTVLAEQHFSMLSNRFADLPVKIAHMSRLTKSTDAQTLKAVTEGAVDILVGTHRVLGGDIQWKNLGLLIIDEEQKFGVSQKEHLKNLRPSIDVLSLSATPIPRTLSMSLSGLRGLSILRTPPHGRLPITTLVEEYSNGLLQQALQTELERGGTVYVVHNRVQSLPLVRDRVEQLLAQLKLDVPVAMAHGQMGELELARAVSGFMQGKVRVLVASSIVEHGLDSPLANTLVVLHSERFGLSDLYQLRGRVGRRSTQAYAYFMLGGVLHEPYTILDEQGNEISGISLSKTARMRLNALQEADQLGSGWSIAVRDLEIRGGGNVLGNEQHGNMEAIGLLLYGQLLQEEIGRQAKLAGITLFQRSAA